MDKEVHSNIFVELLTSNLPEKEKTEERHADEAVSIIAAGTETLAWSICNIPSTATTSND